MSAPDLSDILAANDPNVERVRAALKRRRKFTVETLADELDVSPKRVRDALTKLRDAGFRVPDEVTGEIELLRVSPSQSTAPIPLKLPLLKGERVRFGIVSDTHLGSNECALDDLNAAYDYMLEDGITTVLHPGDLVAGIGVFKGQHNEIHKHTYEDQVEHAIHEYPARKGMVTKLVGGNHDLEGDIGKIGADPCRAVANRRSDIDYLGPYSAWLELANGAFIHMLHGKGGGAYALSYKIQKLIEAYPAGRKPAALILGHFHVSAYLPMRGVQAMYPGCFEWGSKQFNDRLGLQPAVGFWIVDATLADDGSVVGWRPEWKPFYEGRVLA